MLIRSSKLCLFAASILCEITMAVAQTPLPARIRPATTWNSLAPGWANSASVRLDGQQVVFFSGSQFLLYSLSEDRPVSWGNLKEWPGWPSHWVRVDAAAKFDSDTIMLIHQGEWVTYSISRMTISSRPTRLQAWEGWTWPTVDAAVNWDATTILFFRGTQFIRYTMSSTGGRFDASGDYTQWAGWPKHWSRIGGAVNTGDGLIYFFRDNEVVS